MDFFFQLCCRSAKYSLQAILYNKECVLFSAFFFIFQLAEELAYTCYLTFARQPTYLAPEITHFNSDPSSTTDFYVKPADSHYLLRPETIESLWYLYYVTGNKTYQDWGWNIFQVMLKISLTFYLFPYYEITNLVFSCREFKSTHES